VDAFHIQTGELPPQAAYSCPTRNQPMR
jgi:hypothetical protein